MKTCLLRSCVLALSLTCGISGAKAADCYWLRLNGLSVAKSSDFLAPGDYLPLIGLEPGETYSLLSGTEPSIELLGRYR